MITRRIITALCFFSLPLVSYTQQVIYLDLINNSDEYIKLVEESSSQFSKMTDGTVKAQEAILNSLASGESGYAEFEVNNLDNNSKVTFSLVEGTGGTTYSIKLDNGNFSILNAPITNQPFSSQDIFKIERCDSDINVYHNNSIIHTFSSIDNTQIISSKLSVTNANLVGADIPRVRFSFPNPSPSCTGGGNPPFEQNIYAKLKKKLDGSYVFPPSNELHFTYTEDYAIVNGENETLQYQILNWRNRPVQNGTLNNLYGANWQEIILPDPPTTLTGTVNSPLPVPSSLDPVFYYVLEVKDISKDEIYYLRFQYYFIQELQVNNPN